jgi:superfamily II DNA or RNA helicase
MPPVIPTYGAADPDGVNDALADAIADVVEASASTNTFQEQAIEARPYQDDAARQCYDELRRAGRGILQMACRCGKTRVAYGVVRRWLDESAATPGGTGRPPHVLYLVPGLHLLRQTAQKLAAYATAAGDPVPPFLLIGSDTRRIPLGREAGGDSTSMTTDPAFIRNALGAGAPLVVVSTYQSSPLLPDAFDLIISDEAHRTCGSDDPERPFGSVLLTHKTPRGRLFMTATPNYEPRDVSMRDRKLYGGVAYRYHLREGIRAGYVNDFRLVFVGDRVPAPGDDVAVDGGMPTDATPAQVLEASAQCPRLLVFCRNIRHAEGLQVAVEAEAARRGREMTGGSHPPLVAGREMTGGSHPPLVAPLCLSAHSRMSPHLVQAAARAFAATDGVGAQRPRILFNCRLFQEGVEIPGLNGVFFAAPRHAPRDIIQSVCRPLNRRNEAGALKPLSTVFLPVVRDPLQPPDAKGNLERFATVVPFADALADEDPSFYEYLLDPGANRETLVEWVEASASSRSAATGARVQQVEPLLAAIRRVVRYKTGVPRGGGRLLRTARIPWRLAFPKMYGIVHRLRRYVKTTDELKAGEIRIPFHRWYNWVRKEYAVYAAGDECGLTPAQIADLDALPDWRTRGVQGPYPWRESLDFLEACLRTNGGTPPPVEINKGGFVGLDATPMERLSGVLTCINQNDGCDRLDKKTGAGRPGSGFTVAPGKQKDLDELCGRYGLRWRKARGDDGSLPVDAQRRYTGPPTFIQEAFERFKAMYRRQGKTGTPEPYIEENFPGYPKKHAVQEILGYDREVRPGRWRGVDGGGRRRRQRAPAAAAAP